MDDIDWDEIDSLRRDALAENRAEAEYDEVVAFREWQDDMARWESEQDAEDRAGARAYYPGSGHWEDVGLDPMDEAIAGADAHGEPF